jgi:phospholipase C
VVIAYHDSDGRYDHQMSPIVNQSNDPAHHALTHTSTCGTNAGRVVGGYQDRCGYQDPVLPRESGSFDAFVVFEPSLCPRAVG